MPQYEESQPQIEGESHTLSVNIGRIGNKYHHIRVFEATD